MSDNHTTPMSARQFQFAMVAVILFQFFIIGLFYFNVIRDPNHESGSFLFHQGGDQDEFYSLAQSLINGTPARSRLTFGYPITLIPFIVVLKTTQSFQLTPIIALVNALILFPLAQVILAKVAFRLTQRRIVALLSVFLWTAMPLLLYIAMAIIGRAELGAIWAVHLPWPQMLSDPPATLLTLLSFWLLFISLDAPTPRDQFRWSVLLGLATGAAFALRVNTILTTLIIVLILLIYRRPRAVLVMVVLSFLLFTPQLLYNVQQFGSPFTMGYQTNTYDMPANGLFNVSYVFKALSSGYGRWVVVGGVLLSAVMIAAGVVLTRWEKRLGWLVPAWILLYIVFFSLYYYSWMGSWTRFLLPAYPALAIVGAVIGWSVIIRVTRKQM